MAREDDAMALDQEPDNDDAGDDMLHAFSSSNASSESLRDAAMAAAQRELEDEAIESARLAEDAMAAEEAWAAEAAGAAAPGRSCDCPRQARTRAECCAGATLS